MRLRTYVSLVIIAELWWEWIYYTYLRPNTVFTQAVPLISGMNVADAAFFAAVAATTVIIATWNIWGSHGFRWKSRIGPRLPLCYGNRDALHSSECSGEHCLLKVGCEGVVREELRQSIQQSLDRERRERMHQELTAPAPQPAVTKAPVKPKHDEEVDERPRYERIKEYECDEKDQKKDE